MSKESSGIDIHVDILHVGYWADPPGYFDAIVWPEYVRWNQHLFQGTNHSEIEHEAVEDVLVLNTDDLSIDQVADAAVQRLLDKV